MLHIAIDRGGTFTDIYAIYNNRVYVKKILSESPYYEDSNTQGVIEILKEIFQKDIDKIDISLIDSIRFGTTVATNALLEKKGADVTLAITKGFKDLLEIRYQNREDLFELNIKKPPLLYKNVIEIDERVIIENNKPKVLKKLEKLSIKGKGSLAILLMHSYKYKEHEELLAKMAQGFDIVVESNKISPSTKAIERGESALIDAYLTPIVKSYVKKILKNFKDKRKIFFMKSDGNLANSDDFRGINALLSGPAGAISALKALYENEPLIGFDMGGTSSDVSRYDGKVELKYESKISNLYISYPMADIHTVAAGGGSRLFYKNDMFLVGPTSSGSNPGPLCYGRGGYLSLTDANLVTGRLDIDSIGAIFGKNSNEKLNKKLSIDGFLPIAKSLKRSVEEIAEAFIDVANENMARAIKEITIKKGYDPAKHTLCAFGGAGGQHAVGVARKVGIKKIIIPRHSGILSAMGIAHAVEAKDHFKIVEKELNSFDERLFDNLPKGKRSIFLKFKDTEISLEIDYKDNFVEEFYKRYKEIFGFILDREIIVEKIKSQSISKEIEFKREKIKKEKSSPIKRSKIFIDGSYKVASLYKDIGANQKIIGPALILQETSTIVLDENSYAIANEYGDIIIYLEEKEEQKENIKEAKLALLANRFGFIASKMGTILQKASVSANIKERHDFSCAIFDKDGNLIVNAPHIPVHLGSMSSVVKSIIKKFPFPKKGVTYITNVPYEGGSHLPDITIVTPYIENNQVKFWVASRGHHADIGGIVPGSMPPFSTSLEEEGAIIEAFEVIEDFNFKEDILRDIFKRAKAKNIDDNINDIKAQIAANMEGIKGILEIEAKDRDWFFKEILKSSKKIVKEFFKDISFKEAVDYLDNGAKISLKVYKKDEKIVFDFQDSSIQLLSNQNAPYAVVKSAVLYAIRVMIQEDIPLNEGLIEPIEILVKKDSILSPSKDAAIVGGNVTTSQRIVDVILKAFNISAASQGCMNNIIFGNEKFGYYETIGGGAGATKNSNGASAIHTHMTNTKITDVEVIERRYPIMIERFEIRRNSGGDGKFKGGDGIIREYRFLEDLEVAILSERRSFTPFGLNGGKSGKRGENILIKNNKRYNLGGKAQLKVKKGDRLIIKTPGGGGYGKV